MKRKNKRRKKKTRAYLAYVSSKEVENIMSFDSGAEDKGQVSTAFWCTEESNSTSILNKTSIFQRSRSPKTCRCDSIEPSTPERGGQC
jgi:hypothetical protein